MSINPTINNFFTSFSIILMMFIIGFFSEGALTYPEIYTAIWIAMPFSIWEWYKKHVRLSINILFHLMLFILSIFFTLKL